MDKLIENLLVPLNRETPTLFSLLPVALSNVPFHTNTPSIIRYFAEGFPVHLAVHEVSPVVVPPEEYTLPHVHKDIDEINMIISKDNLLYKIQVGAEIYTVSNNVCIWIPKGTLHAANVLRGSGYFITMQINNK
jgi:mannose-6-phosphate isomerase-like protein (cupin superfamily)